MRFIDMSGKQKGREWVKHLAKTDWRAEMVRIEKEAAQIKATESSPRAERKLAQLRNEWVSARNNIRFIETGKTTR